MVVQFRTHSLVLDKGVLFKIETVLQTLLSNCLNNLVKCLFDFKGSNQPKNS